MKKLLLPLIAAVVVSCNVYKAPPFTDVNKILMLQSGMTLEQVKNTLGVDPYDVYHINEQNSVLVSFSYRLKERKFKVKTFNQDEIDRRTTDEASQTAGDVRYNKKDPKTAFILFKNGKMESIITTSGKAASERILIENNNLILIDKDNITDFDLLESETVEVNTDKAGIKIFRKEQKR